MNRRKLVLAAACTLVGICLAWWLTPRPPWAGGDVGSGKPAAEIAARERPKTVPKFVPPVSAKKTLTLDHRAPDYDANKLVKLSMRPGELYDKEGRDDVWASRIEQSVKETLTRDFAAVLPGARLSDVDCRTMTCRLCMEADDLSYLTKARRLAAYVPLADTVHFGPNSRLQNGGASTCLTLVFSASHRAPDDYRAWYQKARQTDLETLRSRETFRPTDFPPIPPI